jgi:predicted  nucleic acid-binding Zn-ribbon protein
MLDLQILKPNAELCSTLLIQPQETVCWKESEHFVGNLDQRSAVAKYRNLISLAKSTDADLVLSPEYSCPWSIVEESIGKGDVPNEGKLWCLGCESITPTELQYLAARHLNVEWVYEGGLDQRPGQFLDTLCYILQCEGAGGVQRTVVAVQFKGEPMADPPDHLERDNMIKGTTRYILRNRDNNETIYLVSVVCSDALTFRMDELDLSMDGLALGHNATEIEWRLRTMLDLLKKEASSSEKEIDSLESEIAGCEDEIRLLSPSLESKQTLLSQFVLELRQMGWKGAVAQDFESFPGAFANDLIGVSALVNELQALLSWLPSPSLPTIVAEHERLAKLVEEVDTINGQISQAMEVQRRNSEESQRLSDEVNNLNMMRPYVVEQAAARLIGLAEMIVRKERDKAKYLAAKRILTSVTLSPYGVEEDSFAKVVSRKNRVLVEIDKEVRSLERVITELEERHGRLARLRGELRATGSKLVAEDTQATHCPLCGAAYEPDELRQRVNSVKDEPHGSDAIREQAEVLNRKPAQLEDIGKEVHDLQCIMDAASRILGVSDCASLHVSEAVGALSNMDSQLAVLSMDLDGLIALRDELASRGLTEDQYQSLRQWFDSTYHESRPESSNESEFEALRAAREWRSFELLSESKSVRSELSQLADRKLSVIATYLRSTPSADEGEADLRRRLDVLDQAVQVYERLAPSFVTSTEETLLDLSIRLRKVQAANEHFEQSKKSLDQTAAARQRNETKIREAAPRLQRQKESKRRADIAVMAIEEVFSKDGRARHFRSFMEENQDEIVQIFKMLHYPREFSNIHFDFEKDSRISRIILQEESGTKRQMAQISSGQRAALALSIFLTLNRKLTHGPPYIMLDDPVAHTDDLNVLSFLDYLREIAVGGGRQVFFATANNKLAVLYAKKFDFLGEEFKLIRLPRPARPSGENVKVSAD